MGPTTFIVPITVFGIYCLGLALLFSYLPTIENLDKIQLQIPSSVRSAQEITQIFENYAQSHFYSIILGFTMLYTFLQTFNIPGSSFLNCCAGALFGFTIGFWLCTINATIGASLAYGMSLFFGKSLTYYFFEQRMRYFASEVDNHRKSLFNYLLFLRITPFLPNWFINLASPVIGVGYFPFCLATFIGVMPQTFLTVEVGLTLAKLNPNEGISVVSIKTLLLLTGLGCLTLLPAIPSVRNKLSYWLIGAPVPDPIKKQK